MNSLFNEFEAETSEAHSIGDEFRKVLMDFINLPIVVDKKNREIETILSSELSCFFAEQRLRRAVKARKETKKI